MLNLARLGYDVDGCECHPGLVAYGNAFLERHGVRATIQNVHPDDAPPIECHYHAMIVGWSSYGHIQRRAVRIALLRALGAGCARGAPLLVCFHARDDLRYPFEIVSRTANIVRRRRGALPAETGDVFGSSFAHLLHPRRPARIRSPSFRLAGTSVCSIKEPNVDRVATCL